MSNPKPFERSTSKPADSKPADSKAGELKTPGGKPLIALTMGDAAGVGPELTVRGFAEFVGAAPRFETDDDWSSPDSTTIQSSIEDQDEPSARLIAIGSIGRLQREVDRFKLSVKLTRIDGPESAPDDHETLGVIEASSVDVSYATIGKVDAGCGQAAVAYLMGAIDLARDRRIDGIMTLPINKEGIHRAGFDFPGHTEILADAFGVKHYAMALYRRGLGVAHVTLHQSLRSVFDSLTAEAIVEKIELLDGLMKRLGVAKPRIGVAALNPHAGDGGLFGDEEKTIVAPAVEKARGRGIESSGPWPVDTLFARAGEGGYDGVVALYHDQGHIALKVMGWRQAVNITLGLPIVRTSVAHGTAYDIAGKSPADTTGFHEAVSAAVKLIATS